MTQMLLNALLLALRAIRRNLMRSFLTVLGVVIGVAAVITMVTLGNGATRMVSDQISGLGSNLLILRPGQQLGPGRDSAGAATNVWFALAAGRPLAFFAGFWTQWTSTRKLKEGEVTIQYAKKESSTDDYHGEYVDFEEIK